MTREQSERIKTMREEGMGYGRIAQTLEISENTVKSFCRRNNLTASGMKETKNVAEVGVHLCRYCGIPVQQNDVTILVNGLPLVHVELKRRGVAIREAFHQIDRYQRNSFWAGSGLFEYSSLQPDKPHSEQCQNLWQHRLLSKSPETC